MVPTSIQPLVERYRRDPRVVGLLLAGSSVNGQSDIFSDIDLYILTKKTLGYSRRLLAKKPILVDCISDTVSEARAVLRHEKGAVHRPFAHYLAHGQILWQRGRVLSQVQTLARHTLAGQTKLTRAEKIMHQYSLDDFLSEMARDERRGDQSSFDAYRRLFLDNAIDFIAKLKGGVLPPPRHVLRYISQLDEPIGREFRKIMTGRSAKTQLAAATRAFRRLNDFAGGVLHGDIQIRPTSK